MGVVESRAHPSSSEVENLGVKLALFGGTLALKPLKLSGDVGMTGKEPKA